MQRAFSLVELSIVLVILGLLTGGILAGQSLIRSAELRNTIGAMDEAQIALRTFQDKYFALPGDFATAQKFWPTSTLNGNGDGRIDFAPSTEYLRVYEQLALAGLVPGSYDGNVGTMASTMRRTAADVYLMINWKSTPVYGFTGNTLRLFNAAGAGPLNLPQNVWQMDTKLDDGRPASGRMLSQDDSSTGGCIITTGSSIDYALSSPDLKCNMRYYFNGNGA